ncbi:MAG: thiamine-phosphate kinase [Bacteroidetes bacterium]|nr:thiamine-phosphate kinase [Bacteroidota bacterium]
MFENNSRTEIETLGEFGLIDHLTQYFENKQKSTLKGVGDDAAVISIDDKKSMLVSTDLLLEGIHFDLTYMPLKHLGYKAVVVNLSDIYAMNGTPHQITVSLGFSNRFSLEALEELYSGIKLACEKYQIDLVGGDTSNAQTGLTISVTAVGTVDNDKVSYRNGAQSGDLVAVSGDLGAAYVGLQYLIREKKIFLENPGIQPDLEGKDYVLERQLKPEARKDIVEYFAENNIVPTSMIDVSDGLSSELHHLAKQSKCGIVIHEDKLPIDPMMYNPCIDIGLEATMCATNGGEDYELLFTIKQTDYDKIKDYHDIHIIGYCNEQVGSVKMISKNNNEYPLVAQGWKAV